MSEKYVLGIDQSTQGTKALLFNKNGWLIARCDLSHKQMVNDRGWVSHDGNEIYENILKLIPMVVEKAAVNKKDIVCVGISNQRETSIAWDRESGIPIAPAIVWQCSRAKEITSKLEKDGYGLMVKEKTGIPLSPYFPAAKISWILNNVDGAKEKDLYGELRYGTMDSYLIYRLTEGSSYKTDYSNASRTQLFNLLSLNWDVVIGKIFGINVKNLPEVRDSNDNFGKTDFNGYLDIKIPILSALGDSHGALFCQGCHEEGMVKATYGTGSSIMMNIGEKSIHSRHGLVTSLAWGFNGKVQYVLEGNINYTGAVISWLKEDLKIIQSAVEAENLAKEANPADSTYLVPAFTGLGAPYWKNDAKAILVGMSRTTGKAEIVKAALDCIAYQITDIIMAMTEDAGITINGLRVDGGPTRNGYLMQLQSDLTNIPVQVPDVEELSGMGAAYCAGIRYGLYKKEEIFNTINRKEFKPSMTLSEKERRYQGWKQAVSIILEK
ncbi:MAG: glycerol kinase [Anaerocolumna sp.]